MTSRQRFGAAGGWRIERPDGSVDVVVVDGHSAVVVVDVVAHQRQLIEHGAGAAHVQTVLAVRRADVEGPAPGYIGSQSCARLQECGNGGRIIRIIHRIIDGILLRASSDFRVLSAPKKVIIQAVLCLNISLITLSCFYKS